MNIRIVFLLFLTCTATIKAQKGFRFETNKTKVVIPFQLINNLIFIPINVNGVALNFLLDTGVEETILLSLDDTEAVSFFDVQKIKLKGLGSDEPIEGLKSTNNVLNLKGFTDRQHDLYIVLDQSFNFSSHVGIPVNGIIGYHFFKNHPVEINYDKRKIIIYNDLTRLQKKTANKFTEIPIALEKNKPYAVASIAIGSHEVPAKLLLDIGNSDALWLFENKDNGIQVPERSFNDYLGKGFSGEINGSRARISSLKLGNFEFFNPIIAFPDSLSLKSVNMVKDRSGSAGGEIFRRFTLIMDYPAKRMYLKRGANYNESFHYNMSGIELQNEGLQWVQETVTLQTAMEDTFDGSGNKSNFKYKFSLKPLYTISNVRQQSPGHLAGLMKGDIIVTINSSPGYRYSLQAINGILKSEDGKWIYLEIERNSQIMKFKFQLKSIL